MIVWGIVENNVDRLNIELEKCFDSIRSKIEFDIELKIPMKFYLQSMSNLNFQTNHYYFPLSIRK